MGKTFSGRQVIRILCREFDFVVVSTRGNHVKLRKRKTVKIITTVVPLHSELARGTFLGVLRLAEISINDFFQAI